MRGLGVVFGSLLVGCATHDASTLLPGAGNGGDGSGEDDASVAVVDASSGALGDASVDSASAPVIDASAQDADATAPPLDVPDSLVKALDGKTYVEESCSPTTYPGWPFDAQRCTYQKGLAVTIANPPPERVARWIVESSTLIVALDALHARDRAHWEEGLVAIATHTMMQSSRIFPLEGQVWESGTAYVFERGVTKTCTTGCYCRINSLARTDWCAYADAVLHVEPASSCLDRYGQASHALTDAWLAQCVANHAASWEADRNEHYRAAAWAANATIAPKFPDPSKADGAAVVAEVKAAFP